MSLALSSGSTLGEVAESLEMGRGSFVPLFCLAQTASSPPLARIAHDTTHGNKEGMLGNRRLDQLVRSVLVWPKSTPGAALFIRLTIEEGARGDCQKRESSLFPPLGAICN